MNTLFKTSLGVVMFLWAASGVGAQTITGTVHDQTTGKPATGDQVVLLRLGRGMEKEALTKTSNQGTFTLNPASSGGQYLIQVTHQGVNYDQPVAGPGSVEINVYDAVNRIPNLRGSVGFAQVESGDGKSLRVAEIYEIINDSDPPVTQLRADNFEITVPPDAVIDSLQLSRGSGMWLKVAPDPVKGQKGKYTINFPIRPGSSQLYFTYHFPYRGRATVRLRVPYPIKKFGIMHPSSMSFKSVLPNAFRSSAVSPTMQGEALATPAVGDVPPFEISGVGTAPQHGTQAANPPSAPAVASPPSNVRAVPANSAAAVTGQSTKELWLMIAGIAAILIVGAYALQRSKRTPAMASANAKPGGQTPLLDALKEQLFQLESDRLHGSISAEEYAATKRALNESIHRALARK